MVNELLTDPALAPNFGLDVVEALQFAHTESLHMLGLAEALETCSATPSTAAAAARVEAYLQSGLMRHLADEEQSLAPRLKGHHEVVDRALATMRSDHFREAAMASRLAGLCGLIGRDVNRLHGLRFSVAQAVSELKTLVVRHQELEESIVFPALRRFLGRAQLDEIDAEMLARTRQPFQGTWH